MKNRRESGIAAESDKNSDTGQPVQRKDGRLSGLMTVFE